MSRIAVFAKLAAKPGRGADVVAALEAAFASAQQEAGTEIYAIHVAPDDPDVVWMYELYVDAEAQLAHTSSEATGRLRSRLADLLGEPLTLLRGTPHLALGFRDVDGVPGTTH